MKKFKYAFEGLKFAFKQKAVLIQALLAIFAIIGGLIIKLDNYEWLAFIICIAGVISLEIVNSVVENLCDLYSKEYDIRIKHIKDMASGAVLVFCIGAFLVCLICVVRRLS